MYGTACSQADLTLQAIADTKVNMTVWLGTYLDPNGNQTINDQQTQWAVDAIQKHGTEHIGGVAIGNECVSPASRGRAWTALRAEHEPADRG